MTSHETVEKLILQSKSTDVDARVDALNKLEPLLEDITEPADIDGIIAALKSCLRTPNHHLTTAALGVLPTLFRRLATYTPPAAGDDVGMGTTSPAPGGRSSASLHQLRQALLAFLPSGGVLDRLGDQREKARDTAREAFVAIAEVAYNCSPQTGSKIKDKSHEPPLAIVEKHVKELGLASKSFRIREQTILSLVAIRRAQPTFPIRPYLPQLVECLEDSDGTVRDCARASIATLFSGPKVTDAARADLKNEMTKKGVRKGIVSDLLSKLLSSSTPSLSSPSTSHGNNDPATEDESTATPPTTTKKPAPPARSQTVPIMGRSVNGAAELGNSQMDEVGPEQSMEIADVYIASTRDLENEFSKMIPCFEGRESEFNWLDREKSIVRIRGMLKGGVHLRYTEAFVSGLKGGILEKTVKGLLSLRTTLSSHACYLYGELATSLSTAFDSLVETILVHLIKTGGITKKLVAQLSQTSVTLILTHTTVHPRLVLPMLWSSAQEKNLQVRNYAMAHVRTFLEIHASRPAGKSAIENAGGVDLLEKVIRRGLGDANAAARETARHVYWMYEEIWPVQGAKVMAELDETAKRQLAKVNPRPGASTSAVASTPAAKKSSVAAAIAASRAKAKILATAPPTLRHAATSGASAAALTTKSMSPPRREAGGSTLTKRAASPSSPGPSRKNGVGLASPPSSRSSSPPPTRPAQPRLSSSANSKPQIGVNPLPQRPRTYSPSPPVSPTPLAKVRRTSSPLSAMASSGSRLRPAMSPTISNSRARATSHQVPHAVRSSLSSAASNTSDQNHNELLMAVRIPLPGSDDEDEDGPNESLNLMSFSSAWEKFEGGGSQSSSTYAPGVSESVIHDSYRAQAQQAESAAAQLLELVSDDDLEGLATPPLLPGLSGLSKGLHSSTAATPKETRPTDPVLVTPKPKSHGLGKAAFRFEESPMVKQSPLLARVILDRDDKTGDWWRFKARVLEEDPPILPPGDDDGTHLQNIISTLSSGTANVDLLKGLIFMCHRHPSQTTQTSPLVSPSRPSANGMLTPTTPSPMSSLKQTTTDPDEFWEEGRHYDSLLKALLHNLTETEIQVTLDYGLVALYELVVHQSTYLTGNESTIFVFLLDIRYANKLTVTEATNSIRDALVEACDPVIGLTIVHQDLDAFLKRAGKEPSAGAEARTSSYCFCLVAMAKFILLLPAEVVEDELPRVQGSLLKALAEQSSAIIREAAYVTIIAAQIKLQDETHLFALLSGLSETQKHLLTYEFEKMKTRGHLSGGQVPGVSLEKLAGKMRHLDALPSRTVA
ncbi:suppressor of tub2 mutation [Tulasnella sp. JGI-2019a]|nr:suppressor of tub2 mutation [Tulasnella sp. JGI-2019a]